MKQVSINQLKVNLAEFAAAAAQGQPLEVTRYNRPYIRITSAAQSGFTAGKSFGQGELKPAIRSRIPLGKILSLVADDRNGR